LNAYFNGVFQAGGLQGSSAAQAFFVKCDAENNPDSVRAAGQVIAEVGLAPAVPNEFIVVRINFSTSGVTLTGLA